LQDSRNQFHPSRNGAVAPEQESRTPKTGEPLILADGRRFVFATVETDVRGWWFTASAHDGRSTLQGNTRLAWDSQANAWRPEGGRRVPERRRVVRPTNEARHRQPD
jgi:hypothetical protein